MALTKAQALTKVKQLGLKAQDYGWNGKFTSYADQKIGNWTYQYLANALNEPIYQIGQDGKQYVEAYPNGSRDTFTGRPVPAEGPNKQNIIEQIQKVADYAALSSAAGAGPTTPSISSLQQKLQDAWGSAQQAGISADEFNSTFNNYYNNRFPQYVAAQNDTRGGLLGFLDKATPIVTNIAAGVITGGLSLPQQITANALIQASQGANPSDIVKNLAATVAANSLTQGVPGVESSKEIPKILSQVNKAIADAGPKAVSETLKSALINAERQAVAALITKQDVVQNALAGAAGGTIADLVGVGLAKLSPSMRDATIQSLSRAAAEYSQYKTAGFSDEEALVKATNGYLAEQQKIESAAAKAKQQTAGLSAEQVGVAQQYGQTAGFASGQAGQYTGLDASGKSFAPVEVTGTSTVDQPAGAGLSITSTATPGARRTSATEARSLAPVTVYGQIEPEELSITSTQPAVAEEEAQPKEQTPEQLRQNMILTSLINKNVTSPLYSSKAKTVAKEAGTPGTAALAQALRVGDVGAPVFGRDEEGRRAGWNLQSLRYMGDVGA